MKRDTRDYGDMLLGVFVYIVSAALLMWFVGWIGLLIIVHVWGTQVLLRGKDTFEASKLAARKRESQVEDDVELVLDFDFNDRVEKP